MPEWDVSLVTDMQALFAFKADFNGDLSRWDVGSVRNMRDMFYLAPKFVGGDLSSWNTSKVTTMRECSTVEWWNVQRRRLNLGRVVRD